MITSNIEPSGTICLNDDIWHIVYSDNSGQTNFKYVFDVYVDNEQLIRAKVYPDVNNGRGYFNVSNILRNEVDIEYFNPPSTPVFVSQELDENNVKVQYTYEIGEDYNLGFSGITDIGLASGTITAYNYLPGLFKRRQEDTTKLSYRGLASNRPRTLIAGLSDNVFAGMPEIGNITINFKLYNSTDTLLYNNNFTVTYRSVIPLLNLGINALKNSFPSIPAVESGYYYDITFYSDKIRIYLDCDNKLHNPLSLHFINAYGYMDTMRFSCRNTLNMTANRKSFNQQEYTFNNTSVDYYNGRVYNESKINYYQDLQWSYKLMSDFLTDEEFEWLSELIYSPLIYLEYDGKYYPVTIKNTNYEYSKRIQSKLKTLELEIELNQNRNGFIR